MTELSYREKFILYLESTHRFKENEPTELATFAEEHLPALLQKNRIATDGNIYTHLDAAFWEEVFTDYLVDEQSTLEERHYAGQVMKALKYYKGFIKFNKTANYKKLFAAKLKKEQSKNDQLSGAKPDVSDFSTPEEEGAARPEGFVSQVCVTHYERNPKDRQKALQKYGYACQVCGMDFEATYGAIGKQFIEVHHLYPVCNMGEDYRFDPLDEATGLVPLCSNCHSMIHRGGRIEQRNGEQVRIPMTLRELQEEYRKRNN